MILFIIISFSLFFFFFLSLVSFVQTNKRKINELNGGGGDILS